MNINKLRLPLDILMTILSVILMGGTMLFPDDRVHQICGISLIVIWVDAGFIFLCTFAVSY